MRGDEKYIVRSGFPKDVSERKGVKARLRDLGGMDQHSCHQRPKVKRKERRKDLPAANARYHVLLAPPSSQLASKVDEAKKFHAAVGLMIA
jgi:hypothetical protein